MALHGLAREEQLRGDLGLLAPSLTRRATSSSRGDRATSADRPAGLHGCRRCPVRGARSEPRARGAAGRPAPGGLPSPPRVPRLRPRRTAPRPPHGRCADRRRPRSSRRAIDSIDRPVARASVKRLERRSVGGDGCRLLGGQEPSTHSRVRASSGFGSGRAASHASIVRAGLIARPIQASALAAHSSSSSPQRGQPAVPHMPGPPRCGRRLGGRGGPVEERQPGREHLVRRHGVVGDRPSRLARTSSATASGAHPRETPLPAPRTDCVPGADRARRSGRPGRAFLGSRPGPRRSGHREQRSGERKARLDRDRRIDAPMALLPRASPGDERLTVVRRGSSSPMPSGQQRADLRRTVESVRGFD